MAWTWGFIGEQREWHVYTVKSAKHDGGILTARPICGGAAFARGASAAKRSTQFTQAHAPVNPAHDICATCMTKWKRKQKGTP